MPDTKLDPATLNATVREVARGIKVSFDRNGEISQTHLLDWIMAMTALFGTATEKVKESKFPVGHCQVCGELVAPYNKHAKYEGGYTCQPSHPEPAATEMPPVLGAAIEAITDAYDETDEGFQCAVDLREWWRTHSEPVAVGMTEELEHVLAVCDDEIAAARRHAAASTASKAARYNGEADAIAASVAAVREAYK